MTLTFDTHSTSLTHLAECFKQLWGLKTAITSKKYIIFTFSHTKACVIKFDLDVKKGKGQPRVIICYLGSTGIDNATYQVSRSSVYCFWRSRFFKVFTIHVHGGHVGHVTQLICINFHSHSPLSFHISFDSKLPNCFCEKQVLTLKSE